MMEKTVCAIMQPHFLPWAGYFNLVVNSTHFVFLTDVQISKQSWQTRNRILVNDEIKFLSVPIKQASSKGKIDKVKINNFYRWRRKLITSINQHYAKSTFSSDIHEITKFIERTEKESLAEFNIELIKFICAKLGIKVNWLESTNIFSRPGKIERLIDICEYVNADIYLSSKGSLEYMEKGDFKTKFRFPVRFQEFVCHEYTQINSQNFTSHLSIVDVVGGLGFEGALNYIKKGWNCYGN